MTKPLVLLFWAASAMHAQDGFFSEWLDRSDQAKADQPRWMTPLATVTPRLEQEFRADFLVEQMATGHDLANYDGGKGLELIPNERVELLINLPPYLEHNNDKIHDGWGDFSFTGKYRLLSANEESGNYILTVFFGATVPTGTYTNGAKAAVLTPTIAGGKGWGKFDVQSTFGAGLPLSRISGLGHALAWNTAFQYHVMQKLWPELEVNSTFWKEGDNNGKKQTFVTPGIIFGRFKLHGRLVMALGGGFQIAATQFHQYNHAVIFTIRFPF
ncbi:MAG TPA: hypothetical protein VK335_26700 [Bryobacteraceae bacterium]|nr:hypothetical protein [Bryobacteraceae bacterium]